MFNVVKNIAVSVVDLCNIDSCTWCIKSSGKRVLGNECPPLVLQYCQEISQEHVTGRLHVAESIQGQRVEGQGVDGRRVGGYSVEENGQPMGNWAILSIFSIRVLEEKYVPGHITHK